MATATETTPHPRSRQRPPRCKCCDAKACLHFVSPFNPNGNVGRPYYICPACDRSRRWVCWADGRGLSWENPRCYCGQPSRQDRIGRDKGCKAGLGFWTCVTGHCDYYSEDIEGLEVWDQPPSQFWPWLLHK